jgi:hypothetical protein
MLYYSFHDNLTNAERIRRAKLKVENAEYDLKLAKERLEIAESAAGNSAAENAAYQKQKQP